MILRGRLIIILFYRDLCQNIYEIYIYCLWLFDIIMLLCVNYYKYCDF